MAEFIIHNLSFPITEGQESATNAVSSKLKRLGVQATCTIYKRSVDMRKRNSPCFVYSVLIRTEQDSEKTITLLKKNGFIPSATDTVEFIQGNEPLKSRIGIIGFGPAGMFAALILSLYGYKPVVFERGADIDRRIADVDEFYKTRTLNEDSNIQFGAGGAGTFSDGKLLTRINDRYCRYVVKKLCEYGAPKSILTDAKPHVGTDKLRNVVKNIAKAITDNGGDILYNTTVHDIVQTGEGVILHTNHGEQLCSCAILCPGHSARDTYRMLLEKGALMQIKPFSVGVRIEHKRQAIEYGLYGDLKDKYPDILPHAEYALSDHFSGRGVYTFCMCPGGLVVPSSSEHGGVVTNGMSYHARSGQNSNSAIAVSVTPDDLGTDPLSGIEFQRKIEQAAFAAGGNNYSAPYQTVKGFLDGEAGSKYSSVVPSYMDGGVTLCDLGKLFPDFVTKCLRSGIISFDKKIQGFACDDAVLTAPETRTSAPVRIVRNENGCCIGLENIYPCGEGAGYAGGITSAAVDGLKTAIKIMERYRAYES